jgi:hypothetical protein
LTVAVGNGQRASVWVPSVDVTELEILRVDARCDTDVLFVYDLAIEYPDLGRVEDDRVVV